MKTKMNLVAILLTAMSLVCAMPNAANAQQIRARITVGTPPVYPDNGQYYYPQSRYYNNSTTTYYKYNSMHPYYGYRHQHGEYGNMRHEYNMREDNMRENWQHGWNGHDNGHHYGQRDERR